MAHRFDITKTTISFSYLTVQIASPKNLRYVEENHTLRVTLKAHIIPLRNTEIMVVGDLPHSASIISPHREKKTKETNIRKHTMS